MRRFGTGSAIEQTVLFGYDCQHLNPHAGYTLTATNDLSDVQAANVGKWLPQTPRNRVSALADYTVSGGRFIGFGGTDAADSVNSFFVPQLRLARRRLALRLQTHPL